MITSEFFWQSLTNSGFSFFSGVPCSILKPVLNKVPANIVYISAVREDSALGVCSGAYLAGKKSVVFMQNSGLGNVVNGLTSFNLIYKVPVLLVITWRGEPGKIDASEHKIMGEITLPMLETLKIPFNVIDNRFSENVKWAVGLMSKESIPVALILKEGVVK